MRKTTIRFAFMALGLILLSTYLYSQKSYNYDELDSYIEKGVEDFNVPGFAVGIVKNGEVVFQKGYGVRNTETGEAVDTKTLFGIASCSKAFTAASMAILVDEGKVDWNDKVIDRLSWFRMYDPAITNDLRIDDLLCHRSGMQTFDGDLLWYGTNYSRREVVERIRYRENKFGLRQKFGYSNVMFITAGEVIEAVSGKAWEEFVTEKILLPIGMNSTTTTNSGFDKSMNVAWPHINGKPQEFINYDNSGPAASLNTSTEDFLKWVQLMLNKGVSGEDTVFSEKQYYNLTQPHTLLNAGRAEKPGGTHFVTYGLGWFMQDFEGVKVVQHGGGLPGFHSKVVFVPEDSLGFVIMANQISPLVEAIYKKILDFYLSDGQKDWAGLYLDYDIKQEAKKKEREKEKLESAIKGTEPTLELTGYIGFYEDEMYGKAEISMKDGRLYVSLLPAKEMFSATLGHWQYNTFSFRFNDAFLPTGYLTFSIGENGKPDYFTIDLENPDFHFYKLKFEKVH
ncbi:MAG: serine hydrolase [Chlorobi bacterium]|nr:serine hydrolase [Chlorobiota bacterium]